MLFQNKKTRDSLYRREVSNILKAIPDGLKGEQQHSKELERSINSILSKGSDEVFSSKHTYSIEELRMALHLTLTKSCTSKYAFDTYGIPRRTLFDHRKLIQKNLEKTL